MALAQSSANYANAMRLSTGSVKSSSYKHQHQNSHTKTQPAVPVEEDYENYAPSSSGDEKKVPKIFVPKLKL